MAIIGIVGADARAVAIGRVIRKAGHTVCFSDVNDYRTSIAAADIVGDGAYAAMPDRQAEACETIVLAVRWQDVDRALEAIGRFEEGIVVDATRPPSLGHLSGAELLAHKLNNPRVVKGFVEPLESAEFIRIASDDVGARAEVGELIARSGRTALDVGPLQRARDIEREIAKQLTL